MIFVNIKDPLDREVSLPEDAWKHIQEGHPELSSWTSISLTIQEPNVIASSSRKANRDIYYKLGALDTYPPLYVAVVVTFWEKRRGIVTTAHLSGNIKSVGSGGFKYVSRK
ncbi:MAG: hypothetical protein ACN4A7_04575 [Thermacetogeniaceae bacterium]|nr:hypothetical protein [Thermoanaerobacterales bacterium]NLN21434.1 hypothetical protein [Syntrophomonadaceae bacterium]